MNSPTPAIHRALTHMMLCALNREAVEPALYENVTAAINSIESPFKDLMLRHLNASREATRRIKIIEPLAYIATLLHIAEDVE